MNYDGTNYYYVKDIFGNIIEVRDMNGDVVAKYEYDAWGNYEINANVGGMANKNPFRYRGYYMDAETGYYYLQTRYYDPGIRRFISSDSYDLIPTLAQSGDLNMYVYCSNNPVMNVDPTGESPEWWQWVLFGVGATLVVAAAVMATIGTGGVAAFGVGALIGSLTVGVGGAAVGGIIGYATGGVDGILGGALAGFGIGAIIGFIVGGSIGLASTKVHSVYVSESNGVVNYVGRTNNIGRRTVEHAVSGRGIVPQEVAKKLTLKQARGLEQALINQFGFAKNGGLLINKINSISARNPIYEKAVLWGYRYMTRKLTWLI